VKETKDGDSYTTYGTIQGGGNTHPRTYTEVYLVLDPILFRHFELSGLENDSESKGIDVASKYHLLGRPKHRKDILTALLRLDEEGAERLGKALRGKAESKALRVLHNKLSQVEDDPSLRSIATPGIVQAYLIACGNNACPYEAKDDPHHTPQEHQTCCRGKGWDRGEPNAQGERFADVMKWAKDAVEEWYLAANTESKGRKTRQRKTRAKRPAKK
jgi:hypothetical protein